MGSGRTRTGGQSKDSGAVTGQSGSLLAAIGNGFENQIGLLLEGITKCSHAIQEAVEKGVDPEKSLKRKRAEEQLQEFQRQKEEMERKKREAATYPVIHPFTGARLMLTSEQRAQLCADLQNATPDQFAHSGAVGPGSLPSAPSMDGSTAVGVKGGAYPIPERGFPPHPSFSPTTPTTPIGPPNFPMTGEPTDPAAPANIGYRICTT